MQNEQIFQRCKLAIARNFSRAANTYDEVAILQQEIGLRLLDRLELINIKPRSILDIGAGTGFTTKSLTHKYPEAQIFNLDIAEGALSFGKQKRSSNTQHYICADAELCPIKSQSIDLIFSNCALHWFLNPEFIFKEMHRILKPEGLLFFSTFGPDTLIELRQSFALVDQKNHVNHFIDMHHIGDILLAIGLQDPVMDMELLTLTYKNLGGLIRDLKFSGENFVFAEEPQGLSSKTTLEKLHSAYENYRNKENLLPATFEVVYGHAWGKELSTLHSSDSEGVIRIPVDHLQRL